MIEFIQTIEDIYGISEEDLLSCIPSWSDYEYSDFRIPKIGETIISKSGIHPKTFKLDTVYFITDKPKIILKKKNGNV